MSDRGLDNAIEYWEIALKKDIKKGKYTEVLEEVTNYSNIFSYYKKEMKKRIENHKNNKKNSDSEDSEGHDSS